jgi:hypothetical protein
VLDVTAWVSGLRLVRASVRPSVGRVAGWPSVGRVAGWPGGWLGAVGGVGVSSSRWELPACGRVLFINGSGRVVAGCARLGAARSTGRGWFDRWVEVE